MMSLARSKIGSAACFPSAPSMRSSPTAFRYVTKIHLTGRLIAQPLREIC